MLVSILTARLVGNPAYWTVCALLEQGVHPLPLVLINPTLVMEGNAKACLDWFLPFTNKSRVTKLCWGRLLSPWAQTSQLRGSACWNSFLFGCNQWIFKQLWKFVHTEGLFNNRVPGTALTVTLQRAWICELSFVGFPSLLFPTSGLLCSL